MANPAVSGDVLRETGGGVRALFIDQEKLEIDLRPLATPGDRPAALVEAVYRVRNDGEMRRVELFFVAGSAPGEASVTLDGAGIPIERVTIPDSELPVTWRSPSATPPLLMSMPIPYRTRDIGEHFRFAVDLAPGGHDLRVTYPFEPSRYATNSPTVMWQLGYVLSPAKEWAGFGNLQLEVLLPPGWRAAAEPELKRKGDILYDSWKYLPGDFIGLTVQAPPPKLLESQWLVLIGGPLVLIFFSLKAGRRFRTQGKALVRFVPWALISGLVLALLLAAAIQFDHARLARAVPGQVSWSYLYANTLLSIFLGLFVFAAGAAGAQLTAWFGSRSKLPGA
jgi:hypothetical protein